MSADTPHFEDADGPRCICEYCRTRRRAALVPALPLTVARGGHVSAGAGGCASWCPACRVDGELRRLVAEHAQAVAGYDAAMQRCVALDRACRMLAEALRGRHAEPPGGEECDACRALGAATAALGGAP